MSPDIERFARRWWAGELGWPGDALSLLAAPLSVGWRLASRARAARLTRLGATRVEGLTVVSVGNLGVGGTGKTPVAAWVSERIVGGGVATAVVTGGHGADEALLLARWNPHVPVIAERERVAAAHHARAAGIGAVVLDDGFQHLRLARDLDIVLLSVADPFPGHVLPRGPFREPPEALARADVVVVTRRGGTAEAGRMLAHAAARFAPGALSAGACLTPVGLVSIDEWPGGRVSSKIEPSSSLLPPGPVLAVCGVARPEAFRAAVEGVLEEPAELLAFGDHHAYSPVDRARIRAHAAGRPVVVTAKDAVKLQPHRSELGDCRVLVEEVRWEWGAEALAGRVDALVAERVGR